jgi:protein-S-isoprenylcysteine O-methyltransferase Ste14
MRQTHPSKATPSVNFKEKYSLVYGVLLMLLALVWLLPWLSRLSGVAMLAPIAGLRVLPVPVWAWVLAPILFGCAVLLEAKISLMRKKLGGCDDTHETVIIIKEGPYKYIRHPGHLAEMTYFGLLPVLLSPWIAFTITALAYMAALVVSYVVMFKQEDRFNLAKWGEEYQKYMGSVPAINFIKGWMQYRNHA